MENHIAMNGGHGPNSYTRNSKFQEEGLDRARYLLINSIEENLDLQKISRALTIADLGCSVGPNTFSCAQTIVQAVQLKFKTQCPELEPPEFHVFFNDTVNNDFNTLFKDLPLDRQYMAAGVPGSFHGRLFPERSMNFMNSSFSLHWLSKVPEEILNEDSRLAWNKGRISYVRSSDEVVKAFRDQFMNDIDAFFSARSAELAVGGLMAIMMPGRPDGTLHSDSVTANILELLGDALADMVKEGLVSEELMDSFNIPIYFPTPSDVKEVVSRHKNLRIVKEDGTYFPPWLNSAGKPRNLSIMIRAAMEGILSGHFGPELPIDDLFERYSYKLEKFSETPRCKYVDKISKILLMVLERK